MEEAADAEERRIGLDAAAGAEEDAAAGAEEDAASGAEEDAADDGNDDAADDGNDVADNDDATDDADAKCNGTRNSSISSEEMTAFST